MIVVQPLALELILLDFVVQSLALELILLDLVQHVQSVVAQPLALELILLDVVQHVQSVVQPLAFVLNLLDDNQKFQLLFILFLQIQIFLNFLLLLIINLSIYLIFILYLPFHSNSFTLNSI